jgi:hypothetical protein
VSKHTPGPWLYRAKSDSVHKPPAEQPYQFGDLIFRFHDECGPNNEDLALILAAPELLEACKVALGIIGFGAEHDQISAAIAKAEGTPE